MQVSRGRSIFRPLGAAMAVLCLSQMAIAQEVPDVAASEAARLRQIEAQMAENARQAETLRSRTGVEAKALANLQGRLVDIADSLQAAEARANRLEDSLMRLDAEEVSAEFDLVSRKRTVSNVLAALQSLERSRPPALAVSPDDANKAAVAAIALAAIAPELQTQMDALKAQLLDIERIRTEQAQERASLARTEAALAERQRLLGVALAERKARQAADQARLRRIAREDAELAREATNLRDLIARISERARAPRPVATVPSLGGPAAYSRLPKRFTEARSMLPWPVTGRLVSTFGSRTASGDLSEEVELTTRPGAVVTAPFSGEVTWAKIFGPLGNVLIIDVGENYSLVLIGVTRLDVQRGELVRAGEPLGQMARSGQGRIRFQIRRNNTPIDPGKWLLPMASAAALP